MSSDTEKLALRKLCKGHHPHDEDTYPMVGWKPSGCTCAALLARTDDAVQAERERIAAALVNSAPTRTAFTSGQIDRFGRIVGLSKEIESAWGDAPHGEGCECDTCLPEYADEPDQQDGLKG